MTTLTNDQPTLAAALWPAPAGSLTRWLVLMVAGVIFVAVAAHIQVPLHPVPITMQTFAVLVIGMAYGWGLGAATLALYMTAGLAGLPVFAPGGPPLKFTFGYIIGFILAAGLVGWLAEKGWDRDVVRAAVAMLAGNALIYIPGLIMLAYALSGVTSQPVTPQQVLAAGFYPFLIGDALKLVLAAVVLPGAWYLIGRREV